mgnify:CR=1 FL=1
MGVPSVLDASRPLFVTDTATVAGAERGATQTTSVLDVHVAATVVAPKRHCSRADRTKPLPVMVTTVPPVSGPEVGATDATRTGGVTENSAPVSTKSAPPFTDTCSRSVVAASCDGLEHRTRAPADSTVAGESTAESVSTLIHLHTVKEPSWLRFEPTT